MILSLYIKEDKQKAGYNNKLKYQKQDSKKAEFTLAYQI